MTGASYTMKASLDMVADIIKTEKIKQKKKDVTRFNTQS